MQKWQFQNRVYPTVNDGGVSLHNLAGIALWKNLVREDFRVEFS